MRERSGAHAQFKQAAATKTNIDRAFLQLATELDKLFTIETSFMRDVVQEVL